MEGAQCEVLVYSGLWCAVNGQAIHLNGEICEQPAATCLSQRADLMAVLAGRL